MNTLLILYLLTGCFAGFTAGLLGVGGGLIIVPVLYYIFSSQLIGATIETGQIMHMALATSLATIVITSLSSSYAHHKKRAVLWKTVGLLSPGIVAGAWAGGLFAAQLSSNILKLVFALFELLMALLLLSGFQPGKRHRDEVAYWQPALSGKSAINGGFIIGLVSAIVGIGGGSLSVPFLHWSGIKIKNAVATSAACGLPIALSGTASYIYTGWHQPFQHLTTLGYVNITAFLAISMTSLIFAPFGVKLAHALPDKTLKRIFAIFLLVLSIRMFVQ